MARVKRFIVQQLDHKWKRVTSLCFTYKEAALNRELLEKNDKFIGAINNYRIVAFYI